MIVKTPVEDELVWLLEVHKHNLPHDTLVQHYYLDNTQVVIAHNADRIMLLPQVVTVLNCFFCGPVRQSLGFLLYSS